MPTTRLGNSRRTIRSRFIGFAHVNPLGGSEHMKELARCADDLGFPGVTITSEQDGLYLDAAEYEPFWSECEKRGLFVFVHPALKLNESGAIQRLRPRPLDGTRVLTCAGNNPPDQLAGIRPTPQPHRAYVAPGGRDCFHSRAVAQLSGQGVLGNERQQDARCDAGPRLRLLHQAEHDLRHRRTSAARSNPSTRRCARYPPIGSFSAPIGRRRFARRISRGRSSTRSESWGRMAKRSFAARPRRC